MKTKIIISIVWLSLLTGQCFAQSTFEGNDFASAPPNPFIGWDNSLPTDALEIRHDGNQPILFSTNGNERMRILQYGNIGIGTQAAQVQPKFMSFLDNGNASLLEDTIFVSTAIYGHNNYSTVEEEGMIHIGVRGLCDGVNQGNEGFWNIAGDYIARFAHHNVGIEAYVGADTMNNEVVGRLGWGVRSIASDHSMSNIAVSGRAAPHPSYPGAFTVGIAGGVDGGGSNMWAGWFEGSGLSVAGIFYPSDESFKENVEPIENALDVIAELNPKSYSYITEGFPSQYFAGETHYGLIAQELETLLPVLVKDANRPNELDDPTDETFTAFKAVNYTGLIPILIAGMKEQQSIIEAQNEALAGVMDQLNAMQSQMDNCCGGDTG